MFFPAYLQEVNAYWRIFIFGRRHRRMTAQAGPVDTGLAFQAPIMAEAGM
jgi:hypothetical protein